LARARNQETVLAHRIDTGVYDIQGMEIFETTSGIRELSKMRSAGLSPLISAGAHQQQSVSILMMLDVLEDVATRHQGIDEAKRG